MHKKAKPNSTTNITIAEVIKNLLIFFKKTPNGAQRIDIISALSRGL